MDKNAQPTSSDIAIHRSAILTRIYETTRIFESDPEIIDALSDKDVSEELRELGIDPRPPLNLVEFIASSSVSKAQSPSDIKDRINELFEAAKEEIFEDGMDSNFTRRLATLVEQHGADVISALGGLIETESRNDEIAAETLRWMGRLDHPSSHDARLNLLERSLKDASVRLRDAAAVALASIADERALPVLRAAIEREKYSELREDMQQVLLQLESMS